jgi:dienelactone hydrolase
MRIEEEVDAGSYLRRLISYAAEPGSRVPAYLLVPKAALASKVKAPAVLCLHPTDNQIGHKVVVGLGGRANRQYAAELADRGYVALAPAYPLLAQYQPDLKALGYQSGTMKAIWDNIRGLDLLESLPFVRAGVFGAIGHSLGGHNSVYTAVFDSRIQAVVSSCGLDSYRDYKDGDIRGWTSDRYMPRLLAYRDRLAEVPFDFPEMIGALAPRMCFISAPLKDDNFKWASVDRIAAAARPVYRLYGGEKNLIVEHPDCAHDFPDEVRQTSYRILDRQLRRAG